MLSLSPSLPLSLSHSLPLSLSPSFPLSLFTATQACGPVDTQLSGASSHRLASVGRPFGSAALSLSPPSPLLVSASARVTSSEIWQFHLSSSRGSRPRAFCSMMIVREFEFESWDMLASSVREP
jgi:hypothetical protein